jgi:hypothetical protein
MVNVEQQAVCFAVRRYWSALSYIYYQGEPERRLTAKLLSKDEARGSRPM